MPQDFARDLGYLAKFLQDLRMHADGLADPAGDRLRALLGEQDAAWAEIRALLSGEPVEMNRAAERSDVAAMDAVPEPATPPLAPTGAAPRRLTVGSLLS